MPKRAIALANAAADGLASADLAIVASGTVTVQAVIHACPMVVVYRLGPLTYRLCEAIVFLATQTGGNPLGGRRVVPELIQESFTPEAVAAEALRVLTDPAHAARVRADLADVRTRLGAAGASRRAGGGGEPARGGGSTGRRETQARGSRRRLTGIAASQFLIHSRACVQSRSLSYCCSSQLLFTPRFFSRSNSASSSRRRL